MWYKIYDDKLGKLIHYKIYDDKLGRVVVGVEGHNCSYAKKRN